ncbi:phage tail assembly protein [Rhodoblastus sp.]|uniref:phage tail assembly protein n=1 Tax=Rhodoblastus sp. TaxID=1962975 RepID=UPI003F96C574
MTDEAAAAAPAEPKIVDLDAGEDFAAQEIALSQPFKLGGVVYDSVTLRVPVGADYEAYTKKGADIDTLGLLTRFTGLPIEVLRRMPSADVKTLDFALGKLLWG